MKTITKKINLYKFYELDENGKENVRKNFLENDIYNLQDIFDEGIEERLKVEFPNSCVKYQYSLSYCQGDGFNIYGDFDFNDFINDDFTEKEKRTLQFYFDNYLVFELVHNYRYSYCCAKYNDLYNDWCFDLESNFLKNINFDLLKKFENVVIEKVEQFCYTMEKEGYDTFYNIDDYLEGFYIDNYFLKSGDIYYD